MLPKNSNSKAYQERKEDKKRLADMQKSRAKDDKFRAAEENARATKEEAERLAENAARKAGAVSLEEREKAKQAFTEKNRRTASSRAYTRMVNVVNTNRLPLKLLMELCSDESAASVDNIGNKSLGKFKAAEKGKRWSSSILIDC